MATYKLIQDIEAEDHILGPLTLRQFIYALVAALMYYLSFLVYAKGLKIMLVVFLPPGLFFSFFAFPFGKDQSTEVWALAKLRFLFKPRRRIWDQSGMKELVTITAPKKVEPVRTNGLSQTEVRSRLSALANTLDSRGWAVKNIDVNAYNQPDPFMSQMSDRLIDVNNLPQEVPNYEVHASDDIMDPRSNPIAQQFDSMITEAEQSHRQQLINQLNNPQPAAATTSSSNWFMNQSASTTAKPAGETPEEKALLERLKAQHQNYQIPYSHMRTLKPLSSDAATPASDDQSSVTPPADPAILSLASNDDLNVATIAREANKAKHGDEPQNEVVISLR